MSDLCFLTIAEASRLIKSRKMSPVDLTRAFLDRIAALDSRLNSYLLVLEDSAMADARTAEAEIMAGNYRGPLHGIPIGLKDIYCTKNVRTTAHSALLRDHVPTEDAFTVQLLARAGAIILGKTATWEFAIGGVSFDLPWPPARNPWNTAHDPGGSSSGSAAAVAAGLAMAAMGSDTGGSIRGPAALCGLAGHKPTYGLVSKRGVLPLSFSLDHAGPLCWTAEDCAILMSALAVHDPLDESCANVGSLDFNIKPSALKGLRVGYARGMTESANVTESVARALSDAMTVMREHGADIVDVELPSTTEFADVATTIARSESYAIHEHALMSTPDLYGASFRQRVLPGALIRGSDYVNATRDRALIIRRLAEVMTKVDVIVTTTAVSAAPKLGEGSSMSRKRPSFTRPFNVTGSPALSICSGYDEAGLPLSLQIIGRPFEDPLVLSVGAAFEAATNFRSRRPALETA